jgi:hypothetical protein
MQSTNGPGRCMLPLAGNVKASALFGALVYARARTQTAITKDYGRPSRPNHKIVEEKND